MVVNVRSLHRLGKGGAPGTSGRSALSAGGAGPATIGLGIAYLPVGAWERAFLALAALFTVSSAIGLSKTLRDQHEARHVVARVDEAKLERLLAEHDPFTVAS